MLANTFTYDRIHPAEGFSTETRGTNVRLPIGLTVLSGTVLGYVSGAAATEVKTISITGSPTGGTWTFTFYGTTSAALAHNATLAAVQTEVDAIFGSGNCTVTGTPGSSYVLTFGGSLANTRIASFTMANALTGGSTPSAAIANTTRGSCGPRQADLYVAGNSDGTETAVGVLREKYVPDNYGGNTANESGSTKQAEGQFMYTGGYFSVDDLTGLDAAGVADLGRLASGTAYNDTGAVLYIAG